MAQFNDWCLTADEQVGNYVCQVITGQDNSLPIAIQAVAARVPTHYASEEKIAHALQILGKAATAELIQGSLPTTSTARSGDLGEILATEWIDAHSGGYRAPIKRLRWKDHRNMAMRGDDIVGVSHNTETQQLHFLKAEVKSRVALTSAVLQEARTSLDAEGGLPSAHTLSFIWGRLLEMNQQPLATAIAEVQLKRGISLQNVKHLIFTFSGNKPTNLLRASLQAYTGTIAQAAIGLRVANHAAFVRAVYERVIEDANNA